MKRIIPSPLLLITAIVLDRVAISTAQIAMGQSLRSLLLLLLSAILIACIVQYFIRDWRHTGFIVLMIPVTFVAYRSLYRLLKINFPQQAAVLGIALILVLGLLYVLVVSRKVWRRIRNPARLTAYFNLVFAALLGFQVLRLGQDGYQVLKSNINPESGSFQALAQDVELQSGSPPDIYVIVLDGYARQDVLWNLYEYDNSEFIDWLKARGFYIAADSHSNYVQTPYTMASFWNLDYLQTWDSSYEYAEYLFEPIQDNRVFRLLDEIGYTTVSFEQAVYYAEIRNSDVYLSDFLPLNNFETLLLADSPLEPLSDIFDLPIPLYTYKTHIQRMSYQLDMLKKVPADIPGPKIVYAHIMAPHPPFVFLENGNIRELQRPYTLAGGIGNHGGMDAYVDGYREQVKFINREIVGVVDAILEESASPPIILLMGDHGPASMFRWDIEDPGCLWERTSNLYAILLPGQQSEDVLYPSITPVNTFRIIFNAYFGADLPFLEDKSYLMFWYEPTLKEDITEERDAITGCTFGSVNDRGVLDSVNTVLDD